MIGRPSTRVTSRGSSRTTRCTRTPWRIGAQSPASVTSTVTCPFGRLISPQITAALRWLTTAPDPQASTAAISVASRALARWPTRYTPAWTTESIGPRGHGVDRPCAKAEARSCAARDDPVLAGGQPRQLMLETGGGSTARRGIGGPCEGQSPAATAPPCGARGPAYTAEVAAPPLERTAERSSASVKPELTSPLLAKRYSATPKTPRIACMISIETISSTIPTGR